jgi:hypothetical protein
MYLLGKLVLGLAHEGMDLEQAMLWLLMALVLRI